LDPLVRAFFKRLYIVLSSLLLLGGLAVLYLWLYYHTPAGQDAQTRIVDIPMGASLHHIATQLAQAGLIRHRSMFVLYVSWLHPGPHLQAGEYALEATLSPAQLVHIMRSGNVVRHVLTIPEGLTVRNIASLVATKGLGNRQIILDLSHDKSFIESLGLAVSSLEGYLFPDTYHVPGAIGERDLLTLMVRTLQTNYTERIAAQGQQLGLTQHEVITLASLIEKEVQVDEERPLIAAVYHNRLQRGMRLQCDPTVIYALGDRFDGNLRKADLRIDSPYNTYRYAGLPPGPIASPGRRSLEAAVAPASVDSLYFVATGRQGRHAFSQTLREHNKAVRKYQLNSSGSP
jgi:UPF0755 protein